MDPIFVKVVILVALGIVCWRLGAAAMNSTPAANVFGGYYTAFTIVLIFMVLVLSKMQYVSVLTDTCVEVVDFVATSVANKFNKHATSSATGATGASSAATPVPAGSPNDYIEWTDNLHVQPKAGAASLNGWTVTVIPVDPAPAKVDSRQRVITQITVLPEPYNVYFDPDPSWGIRGTPAVPTTGRP